MEVGGLKNHCSYSERQNNEKRKGVFLPPLLGIADSTTTKQNITDRVKELPFLSAPKRTLPFSTLHDTPLHLRLRSRLILNRASGLAAVKNYHNKDPNPALRQCSFCMEDSGNQVPETLDHAIAHCTKYNEERRKLKDKLKNTISLIRRRSSLHSQMSQVLTDESKIFIHIVLATPYVIENLSNFKSRVDLLRQTGQFLEHIHSIKPL